MQADANYLLKKIGELTIMLELKDSMIRELQDTIKELSLGKEGTDNEQADYRHKGSAS